VTAEQRACPSCGTAFTLTPAAPRKKFCSTRCKHRWHSAHRKPRRRRARQDAARDDPRPDTPAAAVATTTPAAAPPPGPAALTAAPACPHCRQPVELVAWLVPQAASVTTPPRHADTIRENT
jgi:endogenous inhibitor of DNA gyrase (YacG/DUF329 family)